MSVPVPSIGFVDSHTEGEPTRVLLDGLPELRGATIRARASALETDYPGLRAALIDEPRGCAAMVGALLVPPCESSSAAAAVFVNNVGQLPMCVHACVGIARTLVHCGRMPDQPWGRTLVLETVAGEVGLELEADGYVAVRNVPSYRLHRGVELSTSRGIVRGDVAWGGNWFLIVEDSPVAVAAEQLASLHAFTRELRAALELAGVRGDDGAPIDHVQLCGPSELADSRNFVLCPGGEHDRSACGTGTSARLACLYADGRLALGQRWRQQSITGSVFIGSIDELDASGRPQPTIRGRAWVTAEGRLLFDPRDPLGGLA
ncbi:proline racemase family protein [Enhygromyxa salina]|uniref:4-hydroxyproline epimerase n=1 Tax=Enhygromyxa salina TaxID=215803 RepID=A0A2S9YFL8_9BACT|nr:proline racemase family protein [Enhygromyxa salina]PRQ03900.1 4-hydroxyproline epimerase [Enhygromyxa salina]